jgi:hypothetical protein
MSAQKNPELERSRRHRAGRSRPVHAPNFKRIPGLQTALHHASLTCRRERYADTDVTISRMDQVGDKRPAARRSWWRFSLRELLLVMLVVAGFLGWAVLLFESYRPFSPTQFYRESNDWREDIAAALQEIGEQPPRSSGFAATQTRGRWADQHTVAHRFRLPSEQSGAFFRAFRSRIRNRLTAAGCTLGSSAESNSGVSQAMAITYRLESIAGSINVCFFPSDGSHARLVISHHEQRAGRSALSAGASAGRAAADE